MRLLAGDGEDPDLAGLDLVEELAEAAGTEGDLVAEQRRKQLAAAVVGRRSDTCLGSMPTALASCMGSRWSGPPGDEPPPTASFLGSAFHAATRELMSL